MSGHSKWKQIKYKKAAEDAKRGKIFSKISRVITMSAKELGPDPKTNPKLAALIEKARSVNMPNDNINRAIKKAAEKDSEAMKEVLYEAYGPGGSALIITAITDNSNRTTNEIKHILSENGGKLGEQGSATWAFARLDSSARQNKQESDFVAKFPLNISNEDNNKLSSILEALNDQDDVQEVYSNIAS